VVIEKRIARYITGPLDIIRGSTCETKEDILSDLRARDMGAAATLGNFFPKDQQRKEKKEISIFGRLATLLGTHLGLTVIKKEQRESWERNCCENEPR
jgi:hypothetical protein